jgi:hypothetical protein
MFPVLYFLEHIFLIIIGALLYRIAGIYLPAKRKYLVPFFILVQSWPIWEGFWAHYIGDGPNPEYPGYRVFEGLLYTFDTRKPIAGFIYYNLGPHVHLPTLLSFCDILFVSAVFSLVILDFNLAFKRR